MNLNGVQLRAALTGDFDKEVDKGLTNVETALQAALFDYAVDTQAKWRQDVAQSGLRNAQRLTKTIRVRKYKNSGLNPAAQVFSTFPILQRAFEQATVVRSPEGLTIAQISTQFTGETTQDFNINISLAGLRRRKATAFPAGTVAAAPAEAPILRALFKVNATAADNMLSGSFSYSRTLQEGSAVSNSSIIAKKSD